MGGKSTTSTTTNTPPPEVMAAYKDLLAKANPVAATPYQPYMGGVNGTGMEQNQVTGFNNIANLAGSSNGAFSNASGALGAAAIPTSASVGQYMSPYINGVVNSTMANMAEMNGQQQQGVLGNAIAQGAMGGNRVGVAQSELARQQNLANQQTIAGLYNGAYTNALGAAQADKQANLQAASEYGNLGQTQMQTNLGQAAAQVGAGTQQQQFNYQQYQNQKSYPFQTLGWLANIVEGAGAGMGGTQTTTQPAGNTGAGILGGLLALPWASGGVVHGGNRPQRATGGVIPYSSPSGIVSANDNGMPAANDNGYVPQAATGTNNPSTMPTGAPQQQSQQSGPSFQQGFSGLGANLKKQYPNGILAGIGGDPGLPATAPIPTPNPMTSEIGLPAKVGDVAAPASSGLLSGLASLFGFANGGVARKHYDDGGAVDQTQAPDSLLDNIRAFLSPAASTDSSTAPLSDAQFGSRVGPVPLPDANFNERTGVVPAVSANMGVDLPHFSNTPVVTPPITPDTFTSSVPNAAPSPGVVPSDQAMAQQGVVPPLPPAKTVRDLPVKDVPMAPGDYFQGVDVNTLPAGMRNNNPGNIKFVGQRTPGIVGPSKNTDQGDPQAVFNSPYAGMKAAADLALRKNTNGASTIDQLVAGNGGWTPGNHQAAANIANTMGISPNTPVDLAQPSQMKNFLRGLVTQEHGPAGKLYSDDLIASAVDGITVPTDATAYNGSASPRATPASSALTALAGGNEPSAAPASTGVVPASGQTGVVQPFSNGQTPDANSQGRPYTSGILDALKGLSHGQMPNLSPDARMALMSAGFGMMSSKSPNFLTAVGEGGQQGVKTFQERQQLARENALAQSAITAQQGNLALEGKRVDIAGQELALNVKKTAADIANTTATTAKTNVETAAGRYTQTPTNAGLLIRDVTQPTAPAHLISWSDLQSGAQLPDGSAPSVTSPPVAAGNTPSVPATAPAQNAPVTAAPVQPVGPLPAGTQSQFVTKAPSNIPIDGRMMGPMGSVGSSVVQNETNDGLKAARTNYQASTASQLQLAEMKHDLATMSQSAWTASGPGATFRTNLARAINTPFQMTGFGAPIDEAAIAAGEDMRKQSTRLGFALSSTLGSGEAASIIERAVAAVPSAENSPEGFRRIIAGVEAGNQRANDYYSFLQDWSAKTGGSIKGADEYFNKVNPPEKYATSALLQMAVTPKTQADIDKAPAGTMFNINGQLMVK